MVMHPRFYRASGPEVRERVRAELGLGAGEFAVALLFGGKGSPEMAPLAAELLRDGAARRVIAICGDNPALFERLAPLEAASGSRLVRFGFTDRVAELLAASDLLVTKPGPGSLSEAFHHRLPVVVTRNLHTIPQERFNTDFVARRGLGVVVSSWREIPRVVAGLARDAPRLAGMQANLAVLPPNRAVYEVIELLERTVADPSSQL
jgi:1,2-diacylglycerol 3-beta-galactosyltransferase